MNIKKKIVIELTEEDLEELISKKLHSATKDDVKMLGVKRDGYNKRKELERFQYYVFESKIPDSKAETYYNSY